MFLRPFDRFYQVFPSPSCHFHRYLLIYFFYILNYSIYPSLMRSPSWSIFVYFLCCYITDKTSLTRQTWPAHSWRFALRYFPIFGLLYSFSTSAFFLLLYSPFRFRLGSYIFHKTFLSNVSFTQFLCVVD